MKKLLLFFFLLPCLCQAQYIKQANSVYNGLTVFPGITISNTLVNLNGASSLLPSSDTIRANSMQPGSRYEFRILCQSTTPTVSIPTLTIRVQAGNGNILTLANGVSLIGTGTTVKFVIMGEIWFKSSTQMIVSAEISQNNGAAINTPVASMTPIGTFTPPSGDLIFNVTAQYGGISLGTTSITPLVFHREIYQ